MNQVALLGACRTPARFADLDSLAPAVLRDVECDVDVARRSVRGGERVLFIRRQRDRYVRRKELRRPHARIGDRRQDAKEMGIA